MSDILDHSKVNIGDYLEIQYTGGERFKGGIIRGKVVEITPSCRQVKLETGWCGHDGDLILQRKAVLSDEIATRIREQK